MYLDLPPYENAFYTPGIHYQLHPDILFVYGSNAQGIHGLGSALEARRNYGAKLGVGVGLMGNSYGIPTKSRILKVLDLMVIETYVHDFLQFLHASQRKCYVCAVGTQNAGYDHHEIAPMFRGAKNCWFDARWQPFL